MAIHIEPVVSDFLIYFYDDSAGLSALEQFRAFDRFRAIAVAAVKTGFPKCVEIRGLFGRLEPGDTDGLGARLAARGFHTLRAEVRKDVKVSRLLTLVDEREFTNIYCCDLREI